MTDTSILEKSKKIKTLVEQLVPEDFEEYEVGEMFDEDMKVVICPVCGKKTLDNWHICSNCGWEYDYVDDFDDFDDCNGSSLREYIKAFNYMVENE